VSIDCDCGFKNGTDTFHRDATHERARTVPTPPRRATGSEDILHVRLRREDAIVHNGVLDPNSAFLHKPFTLEALAGKLREVIEQA